MSGYTRIGEETPLLSIHWGWVRRMKDQIPQYGWGIRHLITFLVFLGVTSCYAMRVDLSIAIVAMVNNDSNADFEVFDWDSSTQNILQSAFFWGYVVLQVPSGLLAQSFGARYPLLIGVGVCSIATLLLPLVAHVGGWGGVCALRVIQGLSQGSLFPSMHALLSKWGPPNERGRLASIAFSGCQVGVIITFPIGGLLASSSGGWPSIFYLFGGLGALWCVLWFFFGAGNPEESRIISQEERDYIKASFAEVKVAQTFRTPWKHLFTSGPFWAVILAHCTQNWGFWILMTEMPTYMKTVLGFDIKANGLLSALPYLAMAILIMVFGWIADYIYKKKWLTLEWSRKVFNTVGFWGPALALIALAYINKENVVLGVVLLVLSVSLNAGVYLGFQVNHIDLSPNYASTMMGVTNGISNILSIVGPLVVAAVVTEEGSTEQWKIVFWVSSVIYFVGNILFMYLAKAERQPWDDPDYTNEKPEDVNNKC